MRAPRSGDFFQKGRGQLLLTLSKSPQSTAIRPPHRALTSPNAKPRHRVRNPGPTKGNGKYSLPVPNLRCRVSASASGSAMSSARYPKPTQSHHFFQLSPLHRGGTFPPPGEPLGDEGLKSLMEHHGCCCARLAQSKGGC